MFSLSSKKENIQKACKKKKKFSTERVKELTELPSGLNEGRLLWSFMTFCLQNSREILMSESVPPPAAVTPITSQSHISSGRKVWTSTSNVLLFLLYYHEKPCPNTQPTCYSYSSGTWRTAFLFAATFHVFKDCYQNLNFFTTFPLYLRYAKQFYFIQHLLAGSVSWIYDCLYFYLFLSHFCYTL